MNPFHCVRPLTSIRTGMLMALLAITNTAYCDEAKLTVKATDTTKTVLEKQLNKSITVSLANGKEYTGKLISVGDQMIHIDNLRGMEYFDAIITLEDVQSVVIRTKN